MAPAEDRHAIARALIDALNARDFDTLAEMPLHPEGEFRSAVAALEGRVYTGGADGLREWAEAVDTTWNDFRIEILEIHDIDDERSLLLFRVTGSAKASGLPLDTLTAQVWTWRNGLVWRNESYTDPAEALRATGLRD